MPDRTRHQIQMKICGWTCVTHRSGASHIDQGRHSRFTASVLQRPECLEQEAGQWRNIACNHGNIDIILIHERPSVSLLPSNNTQGKRAQELARAI
jgi:hypothetical protein